MADLTYHSGIGAKVEFTPDETNVTIEGISNKDWSLSSLVLNTLFLPTIYAYQTDARESFLIGFGRLLLAFCYQQRRRRVFQGGPRARRKVGPIS
jgi:hypothetical protein